MKTWPNMKIPDWNSLGFDIIEVNSFIKYTWRNGSWDQGVMVTGQSLQVHLFSSALHYGQACFEGLKAFRGIDEKVNFGRADE
jgi:branched-chain amino acid aminotransferase